MATLNKLSVLADLRGKVGGLVVSSNAGAGYVKPFIPPALKRTIYQQLQRGWFAEASQAWTWLDEGDQNDWSDCAASPGYERHDWFGNAYKLTGAQLWVSTYLALKRCGLGVPEGPPLSAPPAAPTAPVIYLYSSDEVETSSLQFPGAAPAGAAHLLVDFCYKIFSVAPKPRGSFTPFLAVNSDDHGLIDIQETLVAQWGLVPYVVTVNVLTYAMTADGRLSLPTASIARTPG
jgi:hypothetical protein